MWYLEGRQVVAHTQRLRDEFTLEQRGANASMKWQHLGGLERRGGGDFYPPAHAGRKVCEETPPR